MIGLYSLPVRGDTARKGEPLQDAMTIAFYIAAAVAVVATALVIINLNVVHALLCLVVSFLAVAIVFYVCFGVE